MEHKPDRCPQCGVETRRGATVLRFNREGVAITVERVAAEVCPACGEDYIGLQLVEPLWDCIQDAIDKIITARGEKAS